MKNIHVLSTDKFSRLVKIYNDVNKETFILKLDYEVNDLFKEYVNIYITSDEEIKHNDYITDSYRVWQWKDDSSLFGRKKIILTTNQDLIADGVQAIDDEFLEWFVMNPSCERVEVEIDYFKWRKGTQKLDDVFKIIIPKEEPKQEIPQIGTKEFNNLASAYFGGKPKQYLEKEMFELEQELDILSHLRWHNSKPKQETLEEAAQRIFSDFGDITRPSAIKRALELAKWQQERMYSEESECVNMYLDDLNIPRKSEDDKEYSIVGRIKQLEKRYLKEMSEVENYYMQQFKNK